jgi:predicted nucleic acid-binding protein
VLTIDSNVLIYALDRNDPARYTIARKVVAGCVMVPSFLTQQVLGEFAALTLRKRLLPADTVGRQIEDWSHGFAIVPTTVAQLVAAADLAERRQKQFWDMVIVTVAADAGASVLLTEDIGDGEVIAGVRIVNPFNPANDGAVAALFA